MSESTVDPASLILRPSPVGHETKVEAGPSDNTTLLTRPPSPLPSDFEKAHGLKPLFATTEISLHGRPPPKPRPPSRKRKKPAPTKPAFSFSPAVARLHGASIPSGKVDNPDGVSSSYVPPFESVIDPQEDLVQPPSAKRRCVVGISEPSVSTSSVSDSPIVRHAQPSYLVDPSYVRPPTLSAADFSQSYNLSIHTSDPYPAYHHQQLFTMPSASGTPDPLPLQQHGYHLHHHMQPELDHLDIAEHAASSSDTDELGAPPLSSWSAISPWSHHNPSLDHVPSGMTLESGLSSIDNSGVSHSESLTQIDASSFDFDSSL